MRHFQLQKVSKQQSMQVYIKSLIRFSSIKTKLLTFLNQCQSICGWTIQGKSKDESHTHRSSVGEWIKNINARFNTI